MKINKVITALIISGFASSYSLAFADFNDLLNKNEQFNAPQEEFLSQEKAFLYQARMVSPNLIEVTLGADEGYHLYHESIRFEIKESNVKLGDYSIPSGVTKYIPVLGKEMEEHSGIFTFQIPVSGKGDFTLLGFGQGCAAKGLCYPPFIREMKLKIEK